MRALYMKIHQILLPMLLLAAMTACGQKGDLYLPDKPVEAAREAEQQTE